MVASLDFRIIIQSKIMFRCTEIRLQVLRLLDTWCILKETIHQFDFVKKKMSQKCPSKLTFGHTQKPSHDLMSSTNADSCTLMPDEKRFEINSKPF
jgi:hypothetical protein